MPLGGKRVENIRKGWVMLGVAAGRVIKKVQFVLWYDGLKCNIALRAGIGKVVKNKKSCQR
jgi:hypothetical protein